MTNKKSSFFCSTSAVRFLVAAFLISLFSLYGCVSVPPQVAKVHQKELDIIQNLRQSHIGLVDSYVDEKLLNFEEFFFNDYGPAYLKNWQKAFKTTYNRNYDPNKDFPLLYNDLVAEYQELTSPIEKIRYDLKAAINTEYSNAIDTHRAVSRWLDSLEKLNKAQQGAIDDLLAGIKPGLSLDSIDKAIEEAKAKVEKKIDELSKS